MKEQLNGITQAIDYRYEIKFALDRGKAITLNEQLKLMLNVDEHAQENGCYCVHSIYLDDDDLSLLQAKMSGVMKRHTYRIRSYGDVENSYFERKAKWNKLGFKEKAELDPIRLNKWLKGWYFGEVFDEIPSFWIDHTRKPIKPVIWISYTRFAYFDNAKQVRITLDFDIKYRAITAGITGQWQTLDAPVVLEVKYLDTLPNFIKSILSDSHMRQVGFSKYQLTMLSRMKEYQYGRYLDI
jgi:hypothetical protein